MVFRYHFQEYVEIPISWYIDLRAGVAQRISLRGLPPSLVVFIKSKSARVSAAAPVAYRKLPNKIENDRLGPVAGTAYLDTDG